MSAPVASIYERMCEILAALPAIGKTQKNTQQNFMFRGHDDVLNALNPLLAKHGVFVVPEVLDRIAAQRTTSKGSVMFEVNLLVKYRFYGPAGDSVDASAWGEGTDMGDKATNKAMTMAFKNVLNQAFAISTQETVDSDAETPEETVSGGRRGASSGDSSSPPATSGAFQPPPGVTGDGNGFAASRADAVPPDDGGDPAMVRVHFGKNADKRLGELSQKQREWYASIWEPNPEFANDNDRRLKMAAQILCRGAASTDTDEIPF